MEHHDLKAYVQGIHNKISIAVAIAVIKSTPSNFSPQEYAQLLQERIFQNWIKGHETSIFDRKILEFQQEKIFNQITDLLLPPASNNDIKDLEIPNLCGDFNWDDRSSGSSESEADSDGANTVKNINFVEAMVQLKFAVESSKSLSVTQIESFIQACNFKGKTGGEIVLRKAQCSEDSGYGGSSSLFPQQSDTVPSSSIRFVTHSMKTDALLNKCISSLLTTTHHWLMTEPRERFALWKGSVLEHLALVFRSVSHNPICTSAISNFVNNFLDKIWISEQTGQHEVWEYQMLMLAEFCCNKYIIETVISNIIQKMEDLSAKLSSEDIYDSDKLNELYLIEQAPFFLNMLSKLLKAWLELRTASQGKSDKTTTVTSVTELWKKNSMRETSVIEDKKKTVDPIIQDSSTINSWKNICEKLVTSSAKLFPLISFEAWEILETLKSHS